MGLNLIQDLPSGTLNAYRKLATFDWKRMKLFIYSPATVKLNNEIFEHFETEPQFQPPDHDLSIEEERHLTFSRMKKLYTYEIFNLEDYFTDYKKVSDLTLAIAAYDYSLVVRLTLLRSFAINGILGLGTERHLSYIDGIVNFQMGFAFCLTEISHGTNTKAMRTEARYNKETKSFILHTPDFEAAKCWAGCLAKTASHCLVFAQLFTPDGVCHGLHCFIVPVRDPTTMKPLPGVTIIDMGRKIGLNGLDNGVVMFNYMPVPRENLLNKTGDVSEDGTYTSVYKNPKKRLGASLGNLSFGRIMIIGLSLVSMKKALTIAIRYSAARKQFGPEQKPEWSVIEYPTQQWRLFPYLGGVYAVNLFFLRFKSHQYSFIALRLEDQEHDEIANFGQEIHALSCVGKAYCSWLTRDCIQECREACGGHGYLEAAGFGRLRDDNDANCTYEGDNNVLLQQTSNWLLNIYSKRDENSSFPMGTSEFLRDADAILKRVTWSQASFQPTLSNADVVNQCVSAYEWLICWLCKVTSEIVDRNLVKEGCSFKAKNNSQVFRASNLAISYGERVIISWFRDSIPTAETSLQAPLWRLCALFALTRIMKHIYLFVEGGLLNNHSNIVSNIEVHIQRLLQEILPDAVALVDVIAPPDFILNSVLGNADGKVYEHMRNAMVTAKGALTRDSHWKEMRYEVPSKL